MQTDRTAFCPKLLAHPCETFSPNTDKEVVISTEQKTCVPKTKGQRLAPNFIYFAWEHANGFEMCNEMKTQGKWTKMTRLKEIITTHHYSWLHIAMKTVRGLQSRQEAFNLNFEWLNWPYVSQTSSSQTRSTYVGSGWVCGAPRRGRQRPSPRLQGQFNAAQYMSGCWRSNSSIKLHHDAFSFL